jgi:transposase
LQTTGEQKRFHLMGALSLKRLDVIMREYPTIDGEATIRFPKDLEGESAMGRIHVILDNAGPHKNQKLREFLESSPRI